MKYIVPVKIDGKLIHEFTFEVGPPEPAPSEPAEGSQSTERTGWVEFPARPPETPYRASQTP